MPYEIVTPPALVSTVDTIHDAHEIVHNAYRIAYPLEPRGLGGEHSDAQRAHRAHSLAVDRLPETGGTVGPLPDGTTITYQPIA